MGLSIQEIYEAARGAGFTPDQATTWTAIALAESGGETGALNDSGEHSVGLWQVNVASDVRANTWGNLNDPVVNARAAYEISHQGTDMRPWTTTHASHAGSASDYRTYLGEVSAVTGYAGDPRGVEDFGSPRPDPLPPSAQERIGATTTYDQIDLGMDPDSRLDTDGDGLTDAFERLTGSSPDVADTDQDGLSDAHEAVVSQSNPLLADTDRDGLSDSTEEALGTSANQWDSDSDGASDGVEVEYGSDPLKAENGVLTPTAQPVTTPVQAAFARPVAPSAAPAGTATAQSFSGYGLDGGPLTGGTLDSDHDGLSDAFEQMVGLDPLSADTDADGMGDALEHLGSGGSITTAARVVAHTPTEVADALAAQGLDAQGDQDQDGLSNYYEIEHGLDAASADTDSDGLTDSTEMALGTDPTAVDSDADGLTDRIELELGTDPLQHGTPQDQWGLLDDAAPDPLDGPDL